MSTVAVVGAGAAGMMAAIEASKRHRVILLDGNDKCGKKLLLTGNGRCNYWNSDITPDKYNADSEEALERIISEENLSETLNRLEKIGLYPKIKNGYFYPYSNQATSVRELFDRKISACRIGFRTGWKVQSIAKDRDGFSIVSADGKTVRCDKVIIACGSKAYEKTGSDGSGYALAKALGHHINRPLPALTGLISEGKFLKDWEKIRCDAHVTLYGNGKEISSDTGEIQLTAKGVSGICVFNVSGPASRLLEKGEKVELSINFMPHLEEGFYGWFDARSKALPDMTLEEALESIFSYKLLFVLLKRAKTERNARWSDLKEAQRKALCEAIEQFTIPVLGTESYDKAQVCTGGVPLKEISPDTMESAVVPGVYFAGEVLDADGRCGGFNLAFAFTTGYIAGKSV
ncbi:MAG: aminoacetone oxidase family FAD-binding enzyme [Clostridia bacterium]|nr:aminoacetone oxidase family FAD-binding enzyme [Clostridia bacterium]